MCSPCFFFQNSLPEPLFENFLHQAANISANALHLYEKLHLGQKSYVQFRMEDIIPTYNFEQDKAAEPTETQCAQEFRKKQLTKIFGKDQQRLVDDASNKIVQNAFENSGSISDRFRDQSKYGSMLQQLAALSAKDTTFRSQLSTLQYSDAPDQTVSVYLCDADLDFFMAKSKHPKRVKFSLFQNEKTVVPLDIHFHRKTANHKKHS